MSRVSVFRVLAAVGWISATACSVDPSSDSSGGYRVRRSPLVQVSHAESSPRLASLPDLPRGLEPVNHPVRHLSRPALKNFRAPLDAVLQPELPLLSMPVTIAHFAGQGNATSPDTVTGTPPDTNGAVGPHHYVQTVNGGIAIWDKSGTSLVASKALNLLWANYVGTNAGNSCASLNNGDPVVLYDQLADRWFVTQFSLPNESVNAGPSFQCVAVSKTGDPSGAYWLFDYRYAVAVNDYGKFSVWPDAYLATFNLFGASTYIAGNFCAYDRVAMLQGQPTFQHCFEEKGSNPSVFGALPASVDGRVPPPLGSPGLFVQFDQSNNPPFDTLDIWQGKFDWVTPGNSTLSGPVTVSVASFTPMCQGATNGCVPQKTSSTLLDGLDDRLMFRLTYRNFGTHESLLMNHSVVAGSTGGIRWHEIRSPFSSPVLFQEGTYAPADSNWRWMGSIAQDQAQDMALGFSLGASAHDPGIAWTGRLATDATGKMGQGESVVASGASSETIGGSGGRWGDYSQMVLDPTDDCTFWFTTELFNTSGEFTWDTEIASTKFGNCGANDFSGSLSPSQGGVALGGQLQVTVNTQVVSGTAQTITLNVQDLPQGVTASFNPPTITAGSTASLILSAAAAAPLTTTPATFTVIGTSASAVHAWTGKVSVVTLPPPSVTLSNPVDGSTVSGTVAISATASAASKTTLSSLALAIDGVQVASGTSSASYQWDTTALANGTYHAVTATATDSDTGSAVASASVNVSNNPTVTITSPVDGSNPQGSVAFTASANIPLGTSLTTLALMIDGTIAQSDAGTPETYNWDLTNVSTGKHNLSAVATDADGTTATATVNVLVGTLPQVAILSPVSGNTVSKTVTVSASATAPAGTSLSNLALNLDGAPLQSSATSPLTFSWDTTTVKDGPHTLTALATDADTLYATSTPVTLTVANQGATTGGGGCHCGAQSAAPSSAIALALLAVSLFARRRRT